MCLYIYSPDCEEPLQIKIANEGLAFASYERAVVKIDILLKNTTGTPLKRLLILYPRSFSNRPRKKKNRPAGSAIDLLRGSDHFEFDIESLLDSKHWSNLAYREGGYDEYERAIRKDEGEGSHPFKIQDYIVSCKFFRHYDFRNMKDRDPSEEDKDEYRAILHDGGYGVFELEFTEAIAKDKFALFRLVFKPLSIARYSPDKGSPWRNYLYHILWKQETGIGFRITCPTILKEDFLEYLRHRTRSKDDRHAFAKDLLELFNDTHRLGNDTEMLGIDLYRIRIFSNYYPSLEGLGEFYEEDCPVDALERQLQLRHPIAQIIRRIPVFGKLFVRQPGKVYACNIGEGKLATQKRLRTTFQGTHKSVFRLTLSRLRHAAFTLAWVFIGWIALINHYELHEDFPVPPIPPIPFSFLAALAGLAFIALGVYASWLTVYDHYKGKKHGIPSVKRNGKKNRD